MSQRHHRSLEAYDDIRASIDQAFLGTVDNIHVLCQENIEHSG